MSYSSKKSYFSVYKNPLGFTVDITYKVVINSIVFIYIKYSKGVQIFIFFGIPPPPSHAFLDFLKIYLKEGPH